MALSAAPGPAHAARWCAWYDWTTYNCGFDTFEQCLETVRGIGGDCRRNVREEDDRRDRRHRERGWDRR
jgi:hypothetical protein